MITRQQDVKVAHKDLYVFAGSDNIFDSAVVDVDGLPLDITGFNLACLIQEYENSTTLYPASVTIIDPAIGTYQIHILSSLAMSRPRYVYSIIGILESTKVRLQFGQILVE